MSSSEYVDISDFQKLDLRIGLVESAERIAGSKRLIRLVVDLGEKGRRQLVAGLAEWYRPEDLVGKNVVVVTNLKPRKMMGFESHGMLLAAGCGEGEIPVILTVEKPVKPGTKVC
ncbi:MAG: methionine--tRNA ligase subunit beta [Zestosphaera sp.]